MVYGKKSGGGSSTGCNFEKITINHVSGGTNAYYSKMSTTPEHSGLLIVVASDNTIYTIRAVTAGTTISLGTTNDSPRASSAYLFYN